MMRYLLILSVLFFAACSDDPDPLAQLGETCELAADCEGDVCILEHQGFFGSLKYPGGYCTNDECNADNLGLDCAEGVGMCLLHSSSGSYDCYQRCLTDEECPREEYGCLVFDAKNGACVPTSALPAGVAPSLTNQ